MSNYDVEGPLSLGDKLSDDDLLQMAKYPKTVQAGVAALKLLSRRPERVRMDAFREVLRGPKHSMRSKLTVASALVEVPTRESQELLVGTLETSDGRVMRRAAQSLGAIGTIDALDALENVQPPTDDAATMTTLQFAKQRISYRFRSDRHLIKIPSPEKLLQVKGDRRIEFPDLSQVKDELQSEARALPCRLPALDVVDRGAQPVRCLGHDLLFAFRREFSNLTAMRSLLERPAHPLILFKWWSCPEGLAPDTLLFTQPLSDDEVGLVGTRPSGATVYGGRLRLADDRFIFTIGAVPSIYAAPVRLQGEYDARVGTWSIAEGLTDQHVGARRRTLRPLEYQPSSH